MTLEDVTLQLVCADRVLTMERGNDRHDYRRRYPG